MTDVLMIVTNRRLIKKSYLTPRCYLRSYYVLPEGFLTGKKWFSVPTATSFSLALDHLSLVILNNLITSVNLSTKLSSIIIRKIELRYDCLDNTTRFLVKNRASHIMQARTLHRTYYNLTRIDANLLHFLPRFWYILIWSSSICHGVSSNRFSRVYQTSGKLSRQFRRNGLSRSTATSIVHPSQSLPGSTWISP